MSIPSRSHRLLLPHLSLSVLLLLLCAAFLFLRVPPVSAATDDSIVLLDCGSSGGSRDQDGRNWTSDVGSSYGPSSRNNSQTITDAVTVQDPSVPQVPYLTARISTSPFTYSFPVSPGGKFVRLYFYPSNYSAAGAADSLFSVTVSPGNFTLLRNFSASQTTRALNFAYLVREFSVNVSTDHLNLTFTPSPSNLPGGSSSYYAFVNGIEIVPIPSGIFGSAPLIGSTYKMDPTMALETMYRLNVGGNAISAVQDSGSLYRLWADDLLYIYGAGFGVTFSRDPNLTINYTAATPEFIAPGDVYGTARSMGTTASINLNYNLTWMLPVDSGFYYLVRLHFCEIQYPMTQPNQRVFTIYLNNQTAYPDFDVITFAGGIGNPVYRDYAVNFPDGAGRQDLWVALHPYTLSKPEYYDSIMNGLEVFKLSQPDGNLAGPNLITPPEPNPDPRVAPKLGGKGKSKVAPIAGGVGGGVAFVLLICVLVFVIFRCRRKRPGTDSGTGTGTGTGTDKAYGWTPIPLDGHSYSGTSARTTTAGSHASSLPANICRHFSFAEIEAATNGFDEALLLGVGGFGRVYRGAVDGGATKVAIKRGNPMSDQGVHEFRTEIEMLSKLRHRHLVSLIGYCEEKCEMILVYDYMAHGTLREHLYKTKNPPLSWKQRLEICIGAARGIHYLHTGAKHTIIHRDVKTTNILLDEHWVAKVADFGLSKTGPLRDHSHVSTVVKGSFGYLDPEYYRRQQLTEKSDVYSFGVVLFEVLCARPALNSQLPKEQVSLADWALHCQKKGTLDQIVDPHLKGKIATQCLKKFAEIAEKCLADRGTDRPATGDVLWSLEFALQLQLSAEESGNFVEAAGRVDEPSSTDSGGSGTDTTITTTTSTSLSIGDRSIASVECDGLTPSAVFSQIVNPEGR